MNRSITRILVLGAVAALMLAAFATPAFADEATPTVQFHAIVGSVDLYGMDATAAASAISQEASVTNLPKIKFVSAGKPFYLEASKALILDVDSMLAAAFTTSSVEPTFTVPRICKVNTATVDAFVNKVASSVKRSKKSAYYYYAGGGKLKWKSDVYGRVLYPNEGRARVRAALASTVPSGTAPATVTLRYKSYTPKVTDKKLGRALCVDLSQRKLRLYDHSKVLKKYGVAIGMPQYPTPKGKFKIIAKRKNPSWRNPGSAWAANMPSYIAPGPRNPLGTRALYVNSPGIRIHGTYKSWSIGTAASHGCMRMNNRSIEKLYPLVPVGTPLWIVK